MILLVDQAPFWNEGRGYGSYLLGKRRITASSRSNGRLVAPRTRILWFSLDLRPSQAAINSFLILLVASCSNAPPLAPSKLSTCHYHIEIVFESGDDLQNATKNDGNHRIASSLEWYNHFTVLYFSKTYLIHKYYNRSQSTSKREKGLGELLSISEPLLTEIDGQS